MSDILQRIPAGQVVRIELLRGGAGDASGHAIAANIVRTPSAGQAAGPIGNFPCSSIRANSREKPMEMPTPGRCLLIYDPARSS